MNCSEVISNAAYILKENLIKNPYLDSEMLLSKALKIKRENLLTNLNMKLKNKDIIKFNKLIERRRKKEPIAYILGYKSFWKSNFKVNQDVLIPRPETEHVIEEVLKIIPKSASYNILDVGTGSGCLIVSIILERQRSRGTAIDISKNAINIAKYNAKIQHIENRIKFINSDIDKIYINKYDLIVSNPPYIDKIGYNNLDLSVKGYEPSEALLGGNSGTIVIEKVIKKSSFVLKNNGLLAMEIGQGQYFKVSKILKNNRFRISKVIKDYQKIKRCIIARKVN